MCVPAGTVVELTVTEELVPLQTVVAATLKLVTSRTGAGAQVITTRPFAPDPDRVPPNPLPPPPAPGTLPAVPAAPLIPPAPPMAPARSVPALPAGPATVTAVLFMPPEGLPLPPPPPPPAEPPPPPPKLPLFAAPLPPLKAFAVGLHDEFRPAAPITPAPPYPPGAA